MNKTLKMILILTSALFLASCQDNYNPYSLDYKMTLLEVPKGIIINVDDVSLPATARCGAGRGAEQICATRFVFSAVTWRMI